MSQNNPGNRGGGGKNTTHDKCDQNIWANMSLFTEAKSQFKVLAK